MTENISTEKRCPYCAELIKNEAVVCKHCGLNLNTEKPTNTRGNKNPSCPVDGGEMKKSSEGKSNGMAIIVFIIGLLFSLSGIGLIIGIPIILWSLHLATKRRGLWICKSCGHQIERKIGMWEIG